MVFRLKESGTTRDVLLQKFRWLLASRMLHASALGCRALPRSSSFTELPSGCSLSGARPPLTGSDVAPRTGSYQLACCLCCGLQTRGDSPVGLVAHRRLAVTGAAALLLDAPASAVHGVPGERAHQAAVLVPGPAFDHLTVAYLPCQDPHLRRGWIRADTENRTRVICLEDRGSATELYPHGTGGLLDLVQAPGASSMLIARYCLALTVRPWPDGRPRRVAGVEEPALVLGDGFHPVFWHARQDSNLQPPDP